MWVFSSRAQDWITRNNQRGNNWKCLTGWKNLVAFYWNCWATIRTLLFPLGPRMGSQGTTKGTWIENVPQVEQPYQVVPEIYEVPSGQHFFHWDPGWDPKTTQQGLKPKMCDRSKNLVKFLWILMRPHHASFFHQDPGWDPKGPPQRRKLKMSDRWKNLFKLLFEFIRSHQDRTFFH
jgi:hypothetical protein